MKFSTYFKYLGYNVYFYSGIDKKNVLKDDYEYIVYSTVFTFYFDEDVKTINYYKEKYPNANLWIGGISATLMADKFFEATGILPHKGTYDRAEHFKPDYDLFPEHAMKDVSQVFTSRGCRNKCGFCAVKVLEPKYCINPNWKDSIDTSKPRVMIHDNNLTTGDFDHFKEVTNFLTETRQWVTFDNGFDCRFFNEDHLNQIKKIRFERNGLRFAFDNMNQDGHIQKAIKMCLDAGISKNKIMVYVLFNFNDTFDEALYRMEEIKKLGARPYPQQYRPLDDTNLYNQHISKHWDKELLREFRYYWMMPGVYTKMSWKEFINRGGRGWYDQKRMANN